MPLEFTGAKVALMTKVTSFLNMNPALSPSALCPLHWSKVNIQSILGDSVDDKPTVFVELKTHKAGSNTNLKDNLMMIQTRLHTNMLCIVPDG